MTLPVAVLITYLGAAPYLITQAGFDLVNRLLTRRTTLTTVCAVPPGKRRIAHRKE